MTIKNIVVTKIYLILTIALVGCNGTAQTSKDQIVDKTIVTEKNSQEINIKEITKNQATLTAPQQSKTLAAGHKVIRDLLGTDIGKMQFNTKAANTFRTFMTSTLLSSSTNSYNKSPSGKDYSASSDRIQFCANGTYVQATFSQISIDVPDADGTSAGTTYVSGYWEVAALPNGIYIILMYSTDPSVLEQFPNGFMPWFVPKYDKDFVALPSGELYKRTTNISCN